MLGSQAVLEAWGDEFRLAGDARELEIVQVGRADRPAAAVDVQVDATRFARRLDHAQTYASTARRHVDPPRLVEEHGRREDAASLVARAARDLGSLALDRGDRPQQRAELLVEGERLLAQVGPGDHPEGSTRP